MIAWRARLGCLAFGCALWAASLPAAWAEQRVALVIGNGAYQSLNRLDNPVNDMRAVADSLRQAGFAVTTADDLTRDAMLGSIKQFGQRLKAAGPDTVGLFFYAGHGFQVEGTNYLLPVDARLASVTDVAIDRAELGEVVGLEWLLQELRQAGNRLNFVVLDACRNALKTRSLPRSNQGLAEVDAPTGTLVAYATAPGEVAVDGVERNSPYSSALAATLKQPGLVAEEVFREVRNRVLSATDNQQVPWESSSLTGAFYFKPATGRPAPEPTVVDERALDLALWNSIKDQGDPALLEDYLARFPDGAFAAVARRQLAGEATPPAQPRSSYEIIATEQPMQAQQAANVRAEPSSAAGRIGALAAGEMVTVTGQVQGLDWLQVELPDGRLGFVAGGLLGPVAEAGAPPPALAAGQLAALSPAAGPPRDAAALAGRWRGEYRCQQDLIGFTLDVTGAEGQQLAAVFEFFPLPGSPSFPRGKFEMAGSYHGEDGSLELESQRWLKRPLGLQLHDLAGQVDPGGRQIDGQILTTGCNEFVLHRQ